ncbi:hypothetical protein KFL_001150140 [Klebsormidium nitens]|uniref:N-acetyltransferase domain-containing protein n=1 Tax=Klebsormidium nitens TaxID=105231 RepID=A0A1Y1HWL7_KLENI|nr:hypothetical protein KFL_001150140 [Klebsormidium nitens]|eukprot:GAQ82553.1 hypothetical protein KFL_001150140 [Klebsormidium nitens]
MSVNDVSNIHYECVGAAEARQDFDLLRACSELFTGHYGVWGESASRVGARPGARVAMRPGRLRDTCLFDEDTCSLVVAKEAGRLIGHAFVCTFPAFPFDPPLEGTVVWVTQLVVHRDYRHRGIATELCRQALARAQILVTKPPVTYFGLVSSHPYAVRSIERAGGVTCRPWQSEGLANALVAASGIPYVQGKRIDLDERCVIQTDFFVDHSEVDRLAEAEQDWRLGKLEEGEEYFAFARLPSDREASKYCQ